ncbi:hypothetical protein HKD37_01G000759 [Glycine soja]
MKYFFSTITSSMMQSYPPRALDRRLQKDWARDAREDPKVLMSLRSFFRAQNFVLFSPSPFIHLLLPPSFYPWPPMVTHLLLEVASPLSLPSPFRCHSSSKKQRNPLMKKILGLQVPMELTSCVFFAFKFCNKKAFHWNVNGEGSTPKDPLYKILDELRSFKLWKEKQERKEKSKKRVAKDQLTMKDKRHEEEKIEKQNKKKDSKALSTKAKGKEKEEKDSSKKIVKKENHFATKCDIKRALILKQSFYLLLSRETSLSTAIPLELEVIPQVKELLDEGLVRKSLNLCALLVPKIGIMRHQIPMIGGMMNVLSGVTLFCKITHAPNIFMICVHRDSLSRFVLIFCFNANLGAHGEGMMQSYPPRALDRRLQKDWDRDAREGPKVLMSLRTHLLLEVASPLTLPSPLFCHSSSKKQRNPLMKKILGLQAPMELTSLYSFCLIH